MRDFKNDYYYCEICGDKVSHKKAKVIVGHEKCIDEIKKETKLFRFKKFIKSLVRNGGNR